MKSFVVDLEDLSKGLCKDCRQLIKKYKPWNEKKVPGVCITDYAECKKCKMTYSIYKGMIWPIPKVKSLPKS